MVESFIELDQGLLLWIQNIGSPFWDPLAIHAIDLIP